MVPAPALVRLHQDPEEPMPYVGDTALIEALPPEAIEALLAARRPGLRLAAGGRRAAPGGRRAAAARRPATARSPASTPVRPVPVGLALNPEMGAAMHAHMAA